MSNHANNNDLSHTFDRRLVGWWPSGLTSESGTKSVSCFLHK